MSQNPMKTLSIAGAVAMVGLNVTVVAFFVLWLIADGVAISRMESESSMDPSQMLPNSELMWLAAHGSLLMLVVVDVLIVEWLVKNNTTMRQGTRRFSKAIGLTRQSNGG